MLAFLATQLDAALLLGVQLEALAEGIPELSLEVLRIYK